ncbi:helix-turn-helix domain-containing protein [Nitrospira defluvii]|nr:helix-turn-helix domain-containing protein [Nitrospira defluvii]
MLTVKELSAWLNIKPSTLYLWVSRNKIPCRRIHGLVRFEPEAIQAWLKGFEANPSKPFPLPTHDATRDLNQLIEAAKSEVYTRHGETITPSPRTKEEQHGAR